MLKYASVFFIVAISTAYVMGCSAEAKGGDPVAGKKLYEQYCVLCHGQDGKLGMNGAKDLTQSTLSIDERIELMKNGKGLMTPFEGILTEEEMRDIASYAITLKEDK